MFPIQVEISFALFMTCDEDRAEIIQIVISSYSSKIFTQTTKINCVTRSEYHHPRPTNLETINGTKDYFYSYDTDDTCVQAK